MQVLGDILESISGAILVDSRLRRNVVWEKIKPILSPIATPENVELQPLRELYELCEQKHYEYKWMAITKTGNVNVATVKIEVKKSIVFGEGSDINTRFAKTKAAKHALAQLKVISNIVLS
jgi:endoribonuclease Dicer